MRVYGRGPFMKQLFVKEWRQLSIGKVIYPKLCMTETSILVIGPIPKPNLKSADFSWWLFEIVHIVCFEMHMDRPDKSANIFGI